MAAAEAISASIPAAEDQQRVVGLEAAAPTAKVMESMTAVVPMAIATDEELQAAVDAAITDAEEVAEGLERAEDTLVREDEDEDMEERVRQPEKDVSSSSDGHALDQTGPRSNRDAARQERSTNSNGGKDEGTGAKYDPDSLLKEEDMEEEEEDMEEEPDKAMHAPESGAVPRSKVVTMYRSSVQRAAFLERVLQKRHLSSVSEELQSRKDHMAELKEQVTQAMEFVSGLEDELQALEAEEEEITSKPVIAKDKLSILATARDKVTRNLQHQKHIVASREQELQEARLALRFLEVDVAEADERMKAILKLDAMDVANQQQLAQTLRDREQAAVRRIEISQRESQAASKRAEEKAVETERQILRNAREARRTALQRLTEHQKKIARSLAEIQLGRLTSKTKRVEALMTLKKNINEARAAIVAQNKLNAEKEQVRVAAKKKEAMELLASGQNPYEVFRRRSVDARLAREAAMHDVKLRKQSIELQKKLEREEKIYRNQKAARAIEKAYEERFEREMGLDAKEERTRLYIASITKDGRDMLDPTSRMPVQPAEVTQLRTWKFGMNGVNGMRYGNPEEQLMRRIEQNHTKSRLRDESYLSNFDASLRKSSGLLKLDASAAMMSASSTATKDRDEEVPMDFEVDLNMNMDILDDAELDVHARYGESAKLQKIPAKTMNDFIEEGSRHLHQKKILTRVPGAEEGGDDGSGGIIFKPSKLVFRDVEVGRKYSKKVSVTNISYKLNTFKLLELPPELEDVLTVEYSVDKSLGAGMTCTLHVTLTPKRAVDISSAVSFLAYTGYSSLPVECYRQRADVSFAPALDFGDVPVTGNKTVRLSVHNTGALAAKFVATAAPAVSDGDAGSAFVFAKYGKVMGRSKAHLEVTFSPVEEVEYLQEVSVDIEGVGVRSLRLRGRGGKPAVVIEDPEVDFHYCVYGCVYKHGVTLMNRGNVALKLKVVPRPEVGEYIDIAPSSAFIQGNGGTFTFNVSFRPSAEMLTNAARFLVGPETDGGGVPVGSVVKVPIKVNVPGQNPVLFHVRATLTTGGVAIEPKSLNFGNVNSGEEVGQEISITNLSDLPQSFGFSCAREEVAMDCFGMLLPHETIKRTITFTPREQQDTGTGAALTGAAAANAPPEQQQHSQQESSLEVVAPSPAPQTPSQVAGAGASLSTFHEFDLVCKTVLGQTHTVCCSANVVSMPLALSSSRISMPSTVVGDTRYASIYVRNVTDAPQTFEFRAPPESGIVINPCVDTVKVGRRVRVEVEYTPRRGDADALLDVFVDSAAAEASTDVEKEGDARADAAASAEVPEAEADTTTSSVDAMSTGDHSGTEGTGSETARAAGISDADGNGNGDDSLGTASTMRKWIAPCYVKGRTDQVLHLCIETCDIEREIQVRGVAMPQQGRTYGTVDFGKVSTSEASVKVLEIVNRSGRHIRMRASTLRFENFFTIVNQLPALDPGATGKVYIKFTPTGGAQPYSEMLTLSTGTQNVSINLLGVGTGRSLAIEPAVDEIDLGDVTVGGAALREFTVTNTSEVGLGYKVIGQGNCHRRRNGRPTLHYSHVGGFLKRGESTTVSITFSPDRERIRYEEEVNFMIDNGDELVLCQRVKLTGRCWAQRMFICGTYDTPTMSVSSLEPICGLDDFSPGTRTTSAESPTRLSLPFSDSVECGKSASESFDVGLALCDGSKEVGTFTIGPLSDFDTKCGWAVDLMQGNVEPGSTKRITVSFSPPEPEPDQLSFFGVDELRTISLRLRLTCGDASAEYVISAKCELRAT